MFLQGNLILALVYRLYMLGHICTIFTALLRVTLTSILQPSTPAPKHGNKKVKPSEGTPMALKISVSWVLDNNDGEREGAGVTLSVFSLPPFWVWHIKSK